MRFCKLPFRWHGDFLAPVMELNTSSCKTVRLTLEYSILAVIAALLRMVDVSINFEKAFGSAERALIYRSQRAEVLSNNIANADTPNFKAQDLDFSAVLAGQTKGALATPFSLKITNLKHISDQNSADDHHGGVLLYSMPNQPSIDQNTVDQQVEVAKYAENEVHFDAAFTRLNGAFKSLLKVLRGD